MKNEMRKRVLLFIFTVMLFIVPQTTCAADQNTAYKPFVLSHFDDLTGVGEGSGSYTAAVGSVWMQGKPSAPVNDEAAPSGKAEGTSLSEGATDKAIALNVGQSKQNPYISIGFSNVDFKGKLRLSFQFYVPACQNASYSLISVDLRNSADGSSYSNLFVLRGNKNIQLFPKADNQPLVIGNFTTAKWYNVEIFIDGDAKVYDVFIDGENKGSNHALRSDVTFNQIRFSVSNSSIDVTNTKIYIDDLFFGAESMRPTPVFEKTTHESGIDYFETADVPRDMTGIAVRFPFAMDASSFTGNVSLVRGDRSIPVAFTGQYDSNTMVYTAYLTEKAVPCTQYRLTFSGKVKTSLTQQNSLYAGVRLGTPETITVTTELVDFAVTNVYFADSATSTQPLEHIPESGLDTIYANVEVIYTELLENPQNIQSFVLCYQDGLMTGLWAGNITLTPVSSGVYDEHVQIAVPLSEISIDENTRLELVVWDDKKNILPLAKMVEIALERGEGI